MGAQKSEWDKRTAWVWVEYPDHLWHPYDKRGHGVRLDHLLAVRSELLRLLREGVEWREFDPGRATMPRDGLPEENRSSTQAEIYLRLKKVCCSYLRDHPDHPLPTMPKELRVLHPNPRAAPGEVSSLQEPALG